MKVGYMCITETFLLVNINKTKQKLKPQIDGLVRDCSNSSALAMELLQSCTKPSKWHN